VNGSAADKIIINASGEKRVKLKTTKVIGLSLVFFGHGRRKVERGMFG
jgi:hypothetical protein